MRAACQAAPVAGTVARDGAAQLAGPGAASNRPPPPTAVESKKMLASGYLRSIFKIVSAVAADDKTEELSAFAELKAPLLKPLRTSVSLPEHVYTFASARARELFRGNLSAYLAALVRRDIIKQRKENHHASNTLAETQTPHSSHPS